MDPFSSALDLAAAIKAKEVSPVEITQQYLDRIEKHDDELNAYVTVASEQALDAAREAESAVSDGRDLPAFHGVPIAIKDLTETAGIKTTYSSRSYENFVPEEDAFVVRRIKKAGFIVLGKTNTSEFGTFPVAESELNGACHNPWNGAHTSGGSSGGSGVSVATGLSPIAQGTDGGGSVRIPASCNGIFGLKTSRGRISRGPVMGEDWAGFSVHGPLSRSVADAAALLDVMSGYEPGDPYWLPDPDKPFLEEARTDPGQLRVGMITESPTGVPIDPAVVAATEEAVALMESLGHGVEQLSLDWEDPDLSSHFIKVVATTTAYHPDVDLEKVEPANRALADAATDTSSLAYVQAIQSMQRTSRRAMAMWEKVDVVVTPTLALPPVEIGWMFEPEDPWEQLVRAGMFIPFTPLANITGQPAASVPLVWSEAGLPLGVQLIGPPAGEDVLLRLSAQLEQARPWANNHPPGFS